MSLRRKFFIAFLLFSIIPLSLVGWFTFGQMERQITERSISQLESIANVQKKRINEVMSGRLSLIETMTLLDELHVSLRQYDENKDEEAQEKMQQTVRNIKNSLLDTYKIEVYDKDLNFAAGTEDEDEDEEHESISFHSASGNYLEMDEIYKDENNMMRMRFFGPVIDRGERIGVIEVIMNVDPFLAVTEDRGGLGETGEVSIVKKTKLGDALFINPLRFDSGSALVRAVPKEKANIPAVQASNGVEDMFISKQTVDYRGVPVFAVTRYIESMEWGIIVKIDRSEVMSSVASLARVYVFVGLLSILLIIFISFLMARSVTKPISNLVGVAQRIQGGDFSTKNGAKVSGELGVLAVALNNMAKQLRESYAGLEKKVQERTKQLEKSNKFMVGRELRMLDLKREIAGLKNKAGDESESFSDKQEAKEYLVNSKRLGEKDRQAAILNVLEDVEAEKKRAEGLASDLEKFKLAVDNASDNIVITDSEGKILYGNKTVKKITGFSLDEIIGRKAGTKENWGGGMSMDFYQNFWKTIKQEKKIFRGKVQNTRKNGEKYLADLSVSPILDGKGEVEFFVAIERDITKEFEVDRAKTEFVSLASHQLKTPLTAIKWNTEVLLDSISKDRSKKSKETKETIDEIYKSNERMIDLVNALLNVSRIDLGTFAVEPKDIDLKDLSENILKELDSTIKSKSLKVSTSYDKTIGKIFADPKLLTIVIQNLLTNAIKYTPEKGKVVVSLKKDGKFMQFSVKDSGIGIPKQQQSRIFNKLFRAENAVQKVSDGTGLGLYVAKAVVEQSGGKIWFDSKEGTGTTFSFTIPLSGMKKKEGNKELVSID